MKSYSFAYFIKKVLAEVGGLAENCEQLMRIRNFAYNLEKKTFVN